jgi:hypothetical protein
MRLQSIYARSGLVAPARSLVTLYQWMRLHLSIEEVQTEILRVERCLLETNSIKELNNKFKYNTLLFMLPTLVVPHPKPVTDRVIDWDAQRKRFYVGVKTRNAAKWYQKTLKQWVVHFH